MDENQRLDVENNFKELNIDDLKKGIDLLLEDKNRMILDPVSISILSSFRDGKFIIGGKEVPISMYIDDGSNK